MPEGAARHALCHCSACRRHAGAPVAGWATPPAGQLRITGEPKVYHSSEHGRRHFCGACGTRLFYVNAAMLPGMGDVQAATLDGPAALPPQAQIQVAERTGWMRSLETLPEFGR